MLGELGYARPRMRFGLFPALIVLLTVGRAQAEGATASTPRTDRALSDGGSATEQSAVAHEHFERALTWYRAGKYQRAIEELDAALERDPGGKDLVFNLALVQEKLGDLPGAIRSLEHFQSMEKDPVELDRATQTIQRLQGAAVELANQAQSAPSEAPAPCPKVRARGKLDAWVIGTGSVAAASFVLGVVFGARAIALDSPSNRSQARDSALIADLAMASSVLLGAGSVALYFGRYADTPPERAPLPVARPRISAAGLVFHF